MADAAELMNRTAGTTVEFEGWPKTPRLFRDCTITEKIDGTNACVIVTEDQVAAQSRKRLITPDSDNYGFARWVADNADLLREALGIGRHFGEWWGRGIQRGYGRTDRTFSLFNTRVYDDARDLFEESGIGLSVVPVLYTGPFSTGQVTAELDILHTAGSYAAPGYMSPEGVCVFHHAARGVFKALIENDDQPKGEAA